MELTKCKLGELITQRREKNDGSDLPICGVSKDGLIPPKQKDADTSIYNVFYRDDFIFNPARMELNSIAINDMYDRAICSSLYEVFYVHRTDLLLPHYLELIIRQKWFTRYCEFLGQGSAREYCRFGNISEIEIEFPPIEEQQKIVEYNTAIENRIALKQKINDNIKSDMWFLPGIFLIRQSIELGLKALLCRIYNKNKDIQNTFEECCHDVSKLFQKYIVIGEENYLTNKEREWLINYLLSLEDVDSKSDMFRFPFEDEFLSKYQGKFLDNVGVANNLLQAFALVKKCLKKGIPDDENKFNETLEPEFFIFAPHGFGNCWLRQQLSDEGFHVKVNGYISVIDFIYNNQQISKETKFYPLMFMFRNTIELCLKRLFYSTVDNGVPLKVFYSKRKSHLIKKDLWKNVKPVILRYANSSGNDTEVVDIAERLINEINALDKNGDNFRYPTSYSLEYRFDDKILDLNNVYKYFKALINFFDGCASMLDAIAEYQSEMQAEYEAEMDWN